MIIVFVSANSGNVFIREGPSRLSPSVKIPAYNYKKYGVLYEVDEIMDNTGVIWYHLRGLGWAMAEFFTVYEEDGKTPVEPPPLERWIVGLNAEQVQECINFLSASLNSLGVD